MADFETFDAGRVEDGAAEGDWVLVVLMDESDASREWEEMFEQPTVAKALEQYETFLLRLESSPQQTSEAMERWEVDELPAMLVVAPDGSAVNRSCLSAEAVDDPEDIAQYLEDLSRYLSGEEEPWQDN